MEKNKVTTYLLYAIGEIVLVVIGILIAVSLNNWNQSNKEKAEQRVLLEEVLVALKQDSITTERVMRGAKRIYNVYQTIYEVGKGNLTPDSLNNLSLLRRSNSQAMIIWQNYPDLASRVLDQELKKKVLAHFSILHNWKFVMDNFNEFIENDMRAMLREQHLLNYEFYYQKDYNADHSLFPNEMINRDRLISKLNNEDIQQMFFEGMVKTQNYKGFVRGVRQTRKELKEEIMRVLEQR